MANKQTSSNVSFDLVTRRSVIQRHLAELTLTTTDAREQKFYYKLYQTGRADRVQNMIADFLIDLRVRHPNLPL